MKNIRTLIMCLSLIIAGILFATSANASGNGSKGGDTACTTQIAPHGQPIIRCIADGNKKDDGVSAPKHHRHHHHYYHRRHYVHHHGHRSGHHNSHHGRSHGGSCHPSHHSAHHGHR